LNILSIYTVEYEGEKETEKRSPLIMMDLQSAKTIMFYKKEIQEWITEQEKICPYCNSVDTQFNWGYRMCNSCNESWRID